MKKLIKYLAYFTTFNPYKVLILVTSVIAFASFGITNFKLDASSDALVLEGDEAFKTYRKNEKEFGDSSFLIVTYEPNSELFSKESLDQLQSLENDLSKLDGVDSILSLLDAPIFFQPKVSLTEVSDNLKDLTTDGIDLAEAKKEIIDNPIYKELIIGKEGALTAMQIVLKGNSEYDDLINQRYEILEILDSKQPDTNANKQLLNDNLKLINQRISKLNDNESSLSWWPHYDYF